MPSEIKLLISANFLLHSRHKPEEHGIVLDENGYTNIDEHSIN